MYVETIDYTLDPIDLIAVCAGTSYGKVDTKESRVKNCFQNGHMSVFEHVKITFLIDGISRACSHQLVRHRVGCSYTQESQRYVKLDISQDWYVVPPEFDKFVFDAAMQNQAENYQRALEAGIKPEDARYLLPNAAKTKICVTMTLTALFHFLDERLDKHAQWEIRELAAEMLEEVKTINGEYCKIIGWYQDKRGDNDQGNL